MTLRALIVDDEPLARRLLRSMLAREPDVMVAGEAADGRQAAALISELKPDLVFLDVRMPLVDGFGLIEAIGKERMPHVIFVTAFDRYALKAFSVNATDYLLKPFDAERLHEAVMRVVNRVSLGPMPQQIVATLNAIAQQHAAKGYPARIPLRLEDRVQLIGTNEIDRLEAAGKYVGVHAGGVMHVVRETMSEMETLLDPELFLRVHRGHIVNVARVTTIHPYFRGEYILTLHDGTRVRSGRAYKDGLLKLLKASR